MHGRTVMGRGLGVLGGALGGGFAYLVASFVRSGIYHHVSLSYWFAPIDATVLYAIAMLAGGVSMLLHGERILITGAVAGALGELGHGVLKYLVAARGAGFVFPHYFIPEMLLNAVPAALLGAAGAALSSFIVKDRRT